ncbi:MAG: polyphosphate kinase 2 family protein [Spartobacteria bacterium]
MKSTIVTAKPGKKIRLSKIDPAATGGIKKDAALARAAEVREKISVLQEALYAEHQRSVLVVLQAMDTGGKDGSVKNLCTGVNPAGLKITSFKPPSLEERDHDFLWRAHNAAPGKGMIGIWNRSHYEEVLVVRVHKLVPKKIWKERYEQINRFEKHLSQTGTTLVKVMLHISKDEQKERLQARLDDPNKRWKFNPGDLKEREFWDEYQKVYEDAINRCNTDWAPWHVVPANHKWSRDLAIVDLVYRVLKQMNPVYPKLSFDPKTVVIDG